MAALQPEERILVLPTDGAADLLPQWAWDGPVAPNGIVIQVYLPPGAAGVGTGAGDTLKRLETGKRYFGHSPTFFV